MTTLNCLWLSWFFVLTTGATQLIADAPIETASDTTSIHLLSADSSARFAPDRMRRDSTAWHSIVIPEPTMAPAAREPQQHFFRRLTDDFAVQAMAPFSMSTRQAAYVGAGVSLTAGLIACDETIDRNVRDWKTNYALIRHVSPIITEFGSAYGLLTVVGYAGYSVIWKDDDAQATTMLLTEALITSGVWTRVGKLLAGRERPSAAYVYSHERGGRWSGPGGSLRKHSNETVAKYDAFPSGHTATAFAIATVFAKRYSDNAYVPIISYSLATMVGISRMIEHTHWASDVFAGACIGYLCADQVVTHYEAQTDTGATEGGRRTPSMRVSLGMLHRSPALQFALGF